MYVEAKDDRAFIRKTLEQLQNMDAETYKTWICSSDGVNFIKRFKKVVGNLIDYLQKYPQEDKKEKTDAGK
jgi:hypothetical protein